MSQENVELVRRIYEEALIGVLSKAPCRFALLKVSGRQAAA